MNAEGMEDRAYLLRLSIAPPYGEERKGFSSVAFPCRADYILYARQWILNTPQGWQTSKSSSSDSYASSKGASYTTGRYSTDG